MADKFLVEDAFHACRVAHTFLEDRVGCNDLYSASVRNMAWEMFKEAGGKIARYLRDAELERLEWDCGHDVWQEDEDL